MINKQYITQIVNNYFKERIDITNSDIVMLEDLVTAKYNTIIITDKIAKDFKNKEEIIEYLYKENK